MGVSSVLPGHSPFCAQGTVQSSALAKEALLADLLADLLACVRSAGMRPARPHYTHLLAARSCDDLERQRGRLAAAAAPGRLLLAAATSWLLLLAAIAAAAGPLILQVLSQCAAHRRARVPACASSSRECTDVSTNACIARVRACMHAVRLFQALAAVMPAPGAACRSQQTSSSSHHSPTMLSR